jgi:hypothetical protein
MAYTKAIRNLAAKLKVNFIEIEKTNKIHGALTENSYKLSDAWHHDIARQIAAGTSVLRRSLLPLMPHAELFRR